MKNSTVQKSEVPAKSRQRRRRPGEVRVASPHALNIAVHEAQFFMCVLRFRAAKEALVPEDFALLCDALDRADREFAGWRRRERRRPPILPILHAMANDKVVPLKHARAVLEAETLGNRYAR